MPETIGGPKIVNADNTNEKQVHLKAGTKQNIQIYNDTEAARSWHIAVPTQMPAWLIIQPDNGVLAGHGATATITVKVVDNTNPGVQAAVKFGWNPKFDELTDNTLVVNVIQ